MGSAVSACQRIGSVNVAVGMGTTRTRAPAGRCRAAKDADHPAGAGAAAASGSGRGRSGSTARTAAAVTACGPQRRAAMRGWRRARSRPNASRAAAAPSAMIENRVGSAASSSGSEPSQCQGSRIAWWSVPPTMRVPPREKISSTANVTAVARTARFRQKHTATTASTTSSGHPR